MSRGLIRHLDVPAAASGGAGGITQLTGDVTAGPGSGSQAATIANDAVTDAKLRESVAFSVIGKATTGTGNPADIVAGANGVLRRSGSGDLEFGTLVTANIGDDQVTYAKMQDVSQTDVVLGRDTAGAGNVEEITMSALRVMAAIFSQSAEPLKKSWAVRP